MGKVQIIMATYHGEKYLRAQINSILNQKYQDWSLFICDDGSDDRTDEIAAEFTSKYPDRIRYHKNIENKGFVLNFLEGTKIIRNLTAEEELPQYYMFCDQDDVWLPNKIGITLHTMKKLEQMYGTEYPSLVFTDAYVVNERVEKIGDSLLRMEHLNPNHTDLAHILIENKCSGFTMMVNKALCDRLTVLPSKARYHDWWLAIVASAFGEIRFCNKRTSCYRQHNNNQVGTKGFLGYVLNRTRGFFAQKEALRATQEQAAEFLSIYRNRLSRKNCRTVTAFASMNQAGWFERRRRLFCYGFWKTGLIRNLALLFRI